MGIFYTVAVLAAALVVTSSAGLAAALLGVAVKRILPTHHVSNSRQANGLRTSRPEPSAMPQGWGWVVAACSIAALVFIVMKLPNQAEFRHIMHKLTGYPSTRIEIQLREDTPEYRQQVLASLTPLMRAGARPIIYRVLHARARTSSTVRDDIPAYYRFVDGTLQIAMGGTLQGDSGYAVKASLEALGTHSSERVPARLELGDQHLDVLLRPHTTEILSDDAPSVRRDLHQGVLPNGRCRYRMQAEMPVELAGRLWRESFTGAGEADPMNRVIPADMDRFGIEDMHLVRMSHVSGTGGRTFEEVEGDPSRVVGWLELVPPGFQAGQYADCGRELLRRSSPSLRRGMLASVGPSITDVASTGSVRLHGHFSPWYAGSGWKKVTPGKNARVAGTACLAESRTMGAVQIGMIKAGCTAGRTNSSCEAWETLRENTGRDQRQCRRGDI